MGNNIDNEIRLQVRTKADRPVMNTSDTPEYVNLATHYNERQKKQLDAYESLQFTEQSSSYVSSFEDEALLRGEIKPVVVRRNTSVAEPYVPKMYTPEVDVSTYSPTNYLNNVSATQTPVNQNQAEGRLPYQDFPPGNYASVDTLNPKVNREKEYMLVPTALALFYNPVFLILMSLLLIGIIIVEFIGLAYVL